MLLLGQAALIVSVFAALWAVAAGVLGGTMRSVGFVRSAGRGLVGAFVLLTVAVSGVLYALVADRFDVRYVVDYSSRQQPLFYKLSALWGGQDGSIMLWAYLLALFGALVVLWRRRAPADFLPWVYATLGGTLLFFVVVTAFVANPFRTYAPVDVPPDGMGLNPLLQNPWMVIHPPTLYLGYVGVTVPFAFAVAALITGRLDNLWNTLVRRWTLFTFTLLSVGIWLGAYWAYIELGWGGFWAWDPVENASFMPWLTLTAFMHSSVILESRGKFRVWSFILVVLSFVLSVYGTFLTRSGIIQSVHAFGKSSIGTWFMVFLISTTFFAAAVVAWRLPKLKSGATDAFWSREGTFLLGNVLFSGLTIMVFVLTMWPVISETFLGSQVTPEPIQYTKATRPFFLLLILLMGTGPAIGWKAPRGRELGRIFAIPLGAGLVCAGLLLVLGARGPWSLAYFFAAAFVCAGAIQESVRDWRARQADWNEPFLTAAWRSCAAFPRRYGARLTHVAVAMMAVGIAGSADYKKDQIFEALAPNTTVEIDGYMITYQGFDVANASNYDGLSMRLAVQRPGAKAVELVQPERRLYRRNREQPSTEVAILPTLVPSGVSQLRRFGEDFYVIPLNVDPQTGRATFQVLLSPLINWLWAGGILLIIGCHIAVIPSRRPPLAVPAGVPQPAAS